MNSVQDASGSRAQSPSWRRKLVDLLLGDLGPLIALVVVIAAFGAAGEIAGRGAFLTVKNIRTVLADNATIAVAALGMTVIIIAGGIDLSAGTAMTLSATVLAYLLKADVYVAVAVVSALGTGALCGFVNGALISGLRVVPFIVTLGTMLFFLGVAMVISKESRIAPPPANVPMWLRDFCSSSGPNFAYGIMPRIGAGVWVALLLAVLLSVVLQKTVFGRHIFALGSNEATARLCGISVSRTKIALYTFAGLFVGFAGVYYFSVTRSVKSLATS